MSKEMECSRDDLRKQQDKLNDEEKEYGMILDKKISEHEETMMKMELESKTLKEKIEAAFKEQSLKVETFELMKKNIAAKESELEALKKVLEEKKAKQASSVHTPQISCPPVIGKTPISKIKSIMELTEDSDASQ